jgi:hypothetical protein
MQRIAIFAATSAIAVEAARLWAARGATLYLVGRSPGKLESAAADLRVRAGAADRVLTDVADLDRLDEAPAVVRRMIDRLGGVPDIVLLAQGTLPDQAQCVADSDAALAAIRSNALSVVALLTPIAVAMEAAGRGRIAVIGSVAGDRGRQSNYVYGAAKGMVELFLQGLRNRLAPRGVSVTTIKPGFVDTPMTAAFDKKGPLWASAAQVGAGIVEAVDAGRDVVYLPWFWRWIMLIIRSIPERVFKRMKL